MLFTTFSTMAKVANHVSRFKERAVAARRGGADVYTVTHVVCRWTKAEAEDYYQYVTEEMADNEAVDRFIGVKQKH